MLAPNALLLCRLCASFVRPFCDVVSALLHPPPGDTFALMRNPPHLSHPAVATRLKRADGHLRAVIAMIEDGKPCLEIAQQLHAVEKAVANAKRALIHDHMDHCLDVESGPADRDELRAIARYL